MISNTHAVNRIMHGQIVECVTQQADTAIARVAHAQCRRKRHLSLNRQVPLLRVRHLEVGIDQSDRVPRGLWSRYKDKAIRWIRKIDWIKGRSGHTRLVVEQRIRRIESDGGAAL